MSGMYGEMNLCSLAVYYYYYLWSPACYFSLSQVFTPTPLTLVKLRRNVQYWFYFYIFTCYLEHSVRNPIRLFWECGCEFLVYIGYFTWVFFYHFKECEYVLLIYWLVRVYFILFLRSEPMMCYGVMPRRKQTSMAKETWWNRCMFGGKQEKRGSCHIVLDLLISPYSANLLRLHLYRDRGWKTVFGFLLTGTRLPLEFRPALHKTCHGVRLVAQWMRWNNKQGWTQGASNLVSTPAENCKNGRYVRALAKKSQFAFA